MGPITLFDKSFLQSLNVDESVWFDNFFLTNICPLFYVETLADLEKSVGERRTPEEEVGLIADKFPEMHGSPNAYHVDLCMADLMGHQIPMTGQIPLVGGRPVKVNGKRGVVFERSPEAEAFTRWHRGEFLEIERLYAKVWRTALSNVDLGELQKRFRAVGIGQNSFKSLDQAKELAERIVTVQYVPIEIMKLTHFFLSIPWELNNQLFARWRCAGFPALVRFAPYASYVLTIELFFQVAIASNLIGTHRVSNRVDIAYLFYLPFSMLFVSSDKLHRRCAPLFLRDDQEFVWGPDLKEDLGKLNQHYAHLPDSTKDKGILSFAAIPPKEGEFLVAQIWDRHLPKWREKREKTTDDGLSDNSKRAKLEQFKRLKSAPTLKPDEIDFEPRDIDMLAIKRFVRNRKGSWWQVPKDLDGSKAS
jgi:hypothetical protein